MALYSLFFILPVLTVGLETAFFGGLGGLSEIEVFDQGRISGILTWGYETKYNGIIIEQWKSDNQTVSTPFGLDDIEIECTPFELVQNEYINGIKVIYSTTLHNAFVRYVAFYTTNNHTYSCAVDNIFYNSLNDTVDSGNIIFANNYLAGFKSRSGGVIDAISFQFKDIYNQLITTTEMYGYDVGDYNGAVIVSDWTSDPITITITSNPTFKTCTPLFTGNDQYINGYRVQYNDNNINYIGFQLSNGSRHVCSSDKADGVHDTDWIVLPNQFLSGYWIRSSDLKINQFLLQFTDVSLSKRLAKVNGNLIVQTMPSSTKWWYSLRFINTPGDVVISFVAIEENGMWSNCSIVYDEVYGCSSNVYPGFMLPLNLKVIAANNKVIIGNGIVKLFEENFSWDFGNNFGKMDIFTTNVTDAISTDLSDASVSTLGSYAASAIVASKMALEIRDDIIFIIGFVIVFIAIILTFLENGLLLYANLLFEFNISIIMVAFRMIDTMTDFAALYTIFIYEVFIEDNAVNLSLLWAGSLSLIIAYCINLYAIHALKQLQTNSYNSNDWFGNNLSWFVILVLVTCDAYLSAQILSSSLFGMKAFNSSVSLIELKKMEKTKVFTMCCQNMCQMIIQSIFYLTADNAPDFIICSIVLSLIVFFSIFISLGMRAIKTKSVIWKEYDIQLTVIPPQNKSVGSQTTQSAVRNRGKTFLFQKKLASVLDIKMSQIEIGYISYNEQKDQNVFTAHILHQIPKCSGMRNMDVKKLYENKYDSVSDIIADIYGISSNWNTICTVVTNSLKPPLNHLNVNTISSNLDLKIGLPLHTTESKCVEDSVTISEDMFGSVQISLDGNTTTGCVDYDHKDIIDVSLRSRNVSHYSEGPKKIIDIDSPSVHSEGPVAVHNNDAGFPRHILEVISEDKSLRNVPITGYDV